MTKVKKLKVNQYIQYASISCIIKTLYYSTLKSHFVNSKSMQGMNNFLTKQSI